MAESASRLHRPFSGPTTTLTKPQVAALIRRMRSNDQADSRLAFQELVECNRGLVQEPVDYYYNQLPPRAHTSVDRADLQQAGYEGLMKAAQKFDSARNYEFSSYAVPCIRREIRIYLYAHSRTVKIPRAVAEVQGRINAARDQLRAQGIKHPSNAAVAAEANRDSDQETIVTAGHVARLKDYESLGVHSLDAIAAPVIPDRHWAGPELQAVSTLMLERLRRMVAGLTLEQHTALRMRYGLVNGEPIPLKDIAAGMGIPERTVQTHLTNALKALRRSLAAELNDFRGLDLLVCEAA